MTEYNSENQSITIQVPTTFLEEIGTVEKELKVAGKFEKLSPNLQDWLNTIQEGISMPKEQLPKELNDTLQEYITSFRAEMAQFLQGKIAQEIDVVKFKDGILLDIKQRVFVMNTEGYIGEVDTVQDAISKLDKTIGNLKRGDLDVLNQKASSLNLNTNPNQIFFGDNIVIIKSNTERFWTKDQAIFDAKQIKNHLLNLYKKKKQNLKP